MNFDFGEDFGLAKSFSDAPVHAFAPGFSVQKVHTPFEQEAQAEEALSNEIRSDGFNFKLAPV